MLFVCILAALSCSAPIPVDYSKNPESTPAEYQSGELSDWDDFHAAKETWLRETYSICLKKFGLAMSCSGCAAIYEKWIVTVDESGKMKMQFKLTDHVCAGPAPSGFDDCILPFFSQKRFPNLRGRTFRTTLGTGLSC